MKNLTALLVVFLFYLPLIGQTPKTNQEIKRLIEIYKEDPRGPYKDIMWFCKDGTYRIPKERCPEPSPQRARYKAEVISLGETNHVFLGQILSTTGFDEFWDAENQNSRLKQYQLEQYLRAVDDGWVSRKARYYRGAVQAEDEETWGINFYTKLLEKDEVIKNNFYLIRESLKDIPHRGDDNQAQKIRSISLVLADQYPSFMNLRVKLHGRPEQSDIEAVTDFLKKNESKLSAEQKKQFDELIATLKIYYAPVNVTTLRSLANALAYPVSKGLLNKYIDEQGNLSSRDKISALNKVLVSLRDELTAVKSPKDRLNNLDLSIYLENILIREIPKAQTATLGQKLALSKDLVAVLYATGYLEQWEWQELNKRLVLDKESVSLQELKSLIAALRSSVEWGTSMTRAIYGQVIMTFTGFEPLAYGFIDDRIRSSALLPLGRLQSEIDAFYAEKAGITNRVLKIPNQGQIRGLNPGYAMGELEVLEEADEVEVDASKIYIFDRPPADLKPVAGIATVTEGNAVSHVQLLARNLGIPNAIISRENLEALKAYRGTRVFYAVSREGTVIMKRAEEMTPQEKKLFVKNKPPEEMITIPIDEIVLDQKTTVNLKDVRAKDSGKICGPKAANLGELKFLFPNNVVDGLVIPFGVFLDHMKQPIPGQQTTYWQYLNNIFKRQKEMVAKNTNEAEIEKYTLAELGKLRELIKAMPLKKEFLADLEEGFTKTLGAPVGQVPVFLRSDTNMEDLKDFTGAGLNLTVFNVVDKQKIYQGIKDVWASPYTDRSYKWRQKYLLNPENVYPSILIIPSVDVDYSGVVITKGLSTGKANELTVAFSRGAGGAVDGQAAESYLVTREANILLSPARELLYNSLPRTGGVLKKQTSFVAPMLNKSNFNDIKRIAEQIAVAYTKAGHSGPYDIELGFKNNNLWLFQVRPFVENKRAAASEYLQSLSPNIKEVAISLSSTLK